jgi:hypothetical protein
LRTRPACSHSSWARWSPTCSTNTACTGGHNGDTLFADDEDLGQFLALLARYRERFGLRLYHCCLMTTHFHLLVQLPRPQELSALMAGLLRS